MKQFKSINEVINYFTLDKCQQTLEQMKWPDGRIISSQSGIKGTYRDSDLLPWELYLKGLNNPLPNGLMPYTW